MADIGLPGGPNDINDLKQTSLEIQGRTPLKYTNYGI